MPEKNNFPAQLKLQKNSFQQKRGGEQFCRKSDRGNTTETEVAQKVSQLCCSNDHT